MDLGIKQFASIIIAVVVIGGLLTFASGPFQLLVEQKITEQVNSLGV